MANIKPLNLDRFGGLTSMPFDASGFFRLEKADRWWFVTPDGAAFLSFGLNHTQPEYLLQDYNIEFWRKEFGFKESSEAAFRVGFQRKAMSDLAAFGMNTIGTHAPKDAFDNLTVPYVQALWFVNTPYWMSPPVSSFPDVFSDAFERHCERVVQRVILPRRDDPFLLGYTFTDCPMLTDLDADAHGQVPWGRSAPNLPTWPRVLRNIKPDAPGKGAFVSLARERYSTIERFNHSYKSSFSSFDELRDAEDWSSTEKIAGVDDGDDNQAFLVDIMERYYSVSCKAIRGIDTNHLVFGDILNANTGVPDDIVSLVSKHTDLIAYQYYGDYDEQSAILDRWSALTGLPLFHADSSFCVPYKEMPAPIGALCPDQETRARRTFDFATRAFSRPDFIGWNWCGWMDMWAAWKSDRQHTGLQDPFGRYHDPMPETLKRFSSMLYECAVQDRGR